MDEDGEFVPDVSESVEEGVDTEVEARDGVRVRAETGVVLCEEVVELLILEGGV